MKTEVWCHSCWGKGSQQRMLAEVQSYKRGIEYVEGVRCRSDRLRVAQLEGAWTSKRVDKGDRQEKKLAIGVITITRRR